MSLSLLPLAGMFIFGGKKKEGKKKVEYPPGITEDLLHTISDIVFYHGTGLYKILARATPEQDVEHVKKILYHDEGIGPKVTKGAGYKKNTLMK
ncbi:hypothetical protein E3E26_07530 [Thermococcus sp. LS1]|uniref:hypothetical protein n=1 Tax=Thermococcus sp. LS1 TaxID=1638259 RepID=UPI00143A2AE0|nr:hypothetical protein [Thermococcus sp. LS1]NJD99633.1 hypothetical protein [Thermococcus sp. LS1]